MIRAVALALAAVVMTPAHAAAPVCAPREHLAPKDVFRAAVTSSVRLRRDGRHPGAGSGTIIEIDDAGMTVLTCQHVVAAESAVLVDFDRDGAPGLTFPGLVMRTDAVNDLALVRVLAVVQGATARPIASVEPEPYDELYVIASPIKIMRQSAVERLNTKDVRSVLLGGAPVWSFSGESIPGMSGGGILDDTGALVCVLQATLNVGDTQYNQIGFCVPLGTVRHFILGDKPK